VLKKTKCDKVGGLQIHIAFHRSDP
jgi:hypothetical protein